MKMTKAMMIDYIEKSGCVVDFDKAYLQRKSKEYITRLYTHAVQYNKNKG
jgi:hypothetical protein